MYKKSSIKYKDIFINSFIQTIYCLMIMAYSYKLMEEIISYEDDLILSVVKFCIIVLFVYNISCMLHEFGHVLGAIKKGYKIRAFVCGILLIIKNNERFKVKIKVTKNIFGGFIVINLSDKIKDEKTYKNFYKDSKFISLSGIYMNMVLIIIALIKCTIYKFDNISITFIVVNIATIIAACSKKQDLWQAFSLINRDEVINGFLLEELLFQEENNEFMYIKVSEYISNYLKDNKYSIAILSKLIYLIRYSIIFDVNLSDEIIEFLCWSIKRFNEDINNIGIVEKVVMTRLIKEVQYLNRLQVDEKYTVNNRYNIVHPNHNIYIEINSYKKNMDKLIKIKDNYK